MSLFGTTIYYHILEILAIGFQIKYCTKMSQNNCKILPIMEKRHTFFTQYVKEKGIEMTDKVDIRRIFELWGFDRE